MIKTTRNLQSALEEGLALKINSTINVLELEIPMFEDKREWISLINQLEMGNVGKVILLVRNHILSEKSGVEITRLEYNTIKIKSKTPIKLITGFKIYYGTKKELVCSEVNELTLTIDWESSFNNNYMHFLPEDAEHYCTSINIIGSIVDTWIM